MNYHSTPCPCGHRRDTHGIHGCWATGCVCRTDYRNIKRFDWALLLHWTFIGGFCVASWIGVMALVRRVLP